ncbi:MAG: hypothetical protein J6W92_04430 [Paludibacteraceae bacterium]|nr:hypothetical protein [Paludibacteraceae bacterium]
MARIEPMTHLDSMKGKYAKTDRVYTRVRKIDDAIIGVRLKHPVTNDPPSTKQLAAQVLFTTVQGKVAEDIADPTKLAAYKTQFAKQRKYKTLRGFIFHKLYLEEVEDQNNG